MFDSSFDFFALVVAIVALIIATKAMNQVAALRSRLDAIEGDENAGLGAPSATAAARANPGCRDV